MITRHRSRLRLRQATRAQKQPTTHSWMLWATCKIRKTLGASKTRAAAFRRSIHRLNRLLPSFPWTTRLKPLMRSMPWTRALEPRRMAWAQSWGRTSLTLPTRSCSPQLMEAGRIWQLATTQTPGLRFPTTSPWSSEADQNRAFHPNPRKSESKARSRSLDWAK